MTYKALRSWLTVATLGVVAVACSDRNEQTAPLVPAVRQFTTAITAPHTEFTINRAKWQSTYDINVGTGVIDPFQDGMLCHGLRPFDLWNRMRWRPG